ncbi:hypothetical protein [Nocardia sp. CC227C]|uniref:hypothetical protein n=1 Tax=Nocardia sp. CC227C TaxID=3044562 RepID=UPI00278C4C5B|nr:hypothetical protein [Nocardia sp. CC227C]
MPLALKAMQGIHDLLKTSALSVERGPHLHFTGRSPQVEQSLERVRIGTTRPGSYIFDARVPIEPPARLTIDALPSPLSGRAVMTRLYTSTAAVHAAADHTAQGQIDYGPFVEASGVGVSSNLCAAIGRLAGGITKCRPFDISFAWARTRQIDFPTEAMVFTEAMVRTVIKAGTVLERVSKSGQAAVTGTIDTLTTTGELDKRARVRGMVVMERIGTADDPATSHGIVWVTLTSQQYDQAIDAHRRGRPIEARGTLDPDSRRLEIRPFPDGFRIR